MSHRQGIHVNSKLLIQDMIPSSPPPQIKKKIVKSMTTTDRTKLQRPCSYTCFVKKKKDKNIFLATTWSVTLHTNDTYIRLTT